MDHRLNEQQELLRRTAGDFFARDYPIDRMRLLLDAPDEEHHALWQAIVGLGWTAAPFSEEIGGFSGGFLDAAVILEELGRAACPGPYVHSVVAAGLALADAGSELANIVAAGEAVIVPAPSSVGTVEAAGGLTARLLGVPVPTLATHFLVPCEGAVALVAADAPGVDARRLPASGGEPVGSLELSGAHVLGRFPAAVGGLIKAFGAAGSALFLLGAAERALDFAVDYAKQRIQFGRPIGSFQAIQHKCADMLIEVEVGRNLAYRAAAFEDTADLVHAASYAKSYLGDAASRVTRAAIQVHGGVGFVDSHRVQPFYRLALSYNGLYGTPHDHRRAVTALALGEEVA